MDSREAREILLLFRPDSTDAADPRMAEALDQVRRDPELAAWFEQQAAVSAALRAKFKAIPVPPGLKRAIIVGRADHQRIIPLPSAVKILAAAAAIAILVTIGWYSFRNEPNPYTFLTYRDRMARHVQKGVSYMDFTSTNQADIVDYCRKNKAPADFALPARLQQLPGEGGSVVKWNNQNVSMLCLNASAGGARNDVWVFVMGKSVLPDAPASQPQYFEVGNLMTVSWTTGTNVFVVAGSGTQKVLEQFVAD